MGPIDKTFDMGRPTWACLMQRLFSWRICLDCRVQGRFVGIVLLKEHSILQFLAPNVGSYSKKYFGAQRGFTSRK